MPVPEPADDFARRIAHLPPADRTLLLERLRASRQPSSERSIAGIAGEGPTPIAPGQGRMWSVQQAIPEATFFNVPLAVRLSGVLDEGRLRTALDALLERHELLRARFTTIDGTPQLEVDAEARLDLEVLCVGEDDDSDNEIASVAAELCLRPFDCECAPLARAALIDAGDERILLLVVHHLIADNWSFKVLIRDLIVIYGQGARAAPPAPAVTYRDFAVWHREWLTGPSGQRHLEHAVKRLAPPLGRLQLPRTHVEPERSSFAVASEESSIGGGVPAAVDGLARRLGTTRVAVVLSAYVAVLHAFSGQPDIRVGTPISGRGRPEVQEVVGPFYNTVVVRCLVEPTARFEDLLAAVTAELRNALACQEVPFSAVAEQLERTHGLQRPDLFQASFYFEDEPFGRVTTRGLTLEPYRPDEGDAPALSPSQYELTLMVEWHCDRLDARWQYNADLFDAPAVRLFARTFEQFLTGAVTAHAATLGSLLPR
jgi:hypothetical protein